MVEDKKVINSVEEYEKDKKIKELTEKYKKLITKYIKLDKSYHKQQINLYDLRNEFRHLKIKHKKQEEELNCLNQENIKLSREYKSINNRRLHLLYLKWKYEFLNNNLKEDISNFKLENNQLEERKKALDRYSKQLGYTDFKENKDLS